MTDVFSTDVLTGVVNSLVAPPSFLLDTFFPTVQTETGEEIHFDVLNKTRRMAPFVSPVVAGKVVASQGMSTSTFKPAYIKPKTVFDINRPLKRAAGEQIGGNLNPMERINRAIAADLADHRDQIQRRLEWMAMSVLRAGSVTISGDEYPTQNVSFGRDAALTVSVADGSRWDDTGINPLTVLRAWHSLVLQKSGASAREVIMTTDVWEVFVANAEVAKRLDQTHVNSAALSPTVHDLEGGVYMGTIDGFNIWVYEAWYVDPATGNEAAMLPAASCLLVSRRLDGVRAFGAIKDEAAGYQAVPVFSKSWVENDPSVRYLLTQSAPLIVPTRVNASLAASTVIGS